MLNFPPEPYCSAHRACKVLSLLSSAGQTKLVLELKHGFPYSKESQALTECQVRRTFA